VKVTSTVPPAPIVGSLWVIPAQLSSWARGITIALEAIGGGGALDPPNGGSGASARLA